MIGYSGRAVRRSCLDIIVEGGMNGSSSTRVTRQLAMKQLGLLRNLAA